MTSALARLPPRIEAELQAALRQAEQEPHRRSEILGTTALGLAARSQHPQHAQEAPLLRALAEQIAEAAMAAPLLEPATRDDFLETLQEHDEAHRAFDVDQDVEARADDLHDARIVKHGPRVSIAPLSWGAGATLGRTGRFKYGATSDDIANNITQAGTLAYWQGEPHEAQAITVDLAPPADGQPPPLVALPTPDPLAADTVTRPRGIVSYGSDGAITRVAFDAGFGGRLTVLGNYVAVQLSMEPPASGSAAGTMAFTASIGAFAAPSVAPVFFTAYVDQLENADTSAPIQRPMHASHLLPILSNATAGNVLLEFYGQGLRTVLLQFTYPIGQLLNPIPLPGEVQYVTLTNLTGASPANFRVPFQLFV